MEINGHAHSPVYRLLKMPHIYLQYVGSGEKAEVDPEIYDVIENIHDTLLEFINNNPDAWAPIVTKVELA
jgi:hypothetical protein